MHSTLYDYTCQYCNKPFKSKNSPGCKDKPKFCSRECYGKSKRGKPPSNKGQKRDYPPWNKKPGISIICEICGAEFEVQPHRGDAARYCSRECSHEAKRRVTGPGHPLWRRIQMECEWCGKLVWVKPAKIDEFRFCSRKCLGTCMAAQAAEWKGPTDIEQLLMNELDRRHIVYRSQHKIARWLIDITIPEHRIAIEADGDYWHSPPEQQEKDANKNHDLEIRKWTVFRFWGSEIRRSPARCIDEVLAHIGIKQLAFQSLDSPPIVPTVLSTAE